jgi:hypothetical protein
MPSIYAAFAVILPVALGLGLVYLSSIGRIDAYMAVIVAIGIAAVMAGGVWARDAAERRELSGETEGDR